MRQLLTKRLRQWVDRGQQRPTGHRNALVLAIAARKGGVGKTTTSVNLAAALARFHGRRVLLLDLDAQGHVETSLRTLARPGGERLSQVLLREHGADVLDAVAESHLGGLDLATSDPGLAPAEEQLGSRIGKEMLLRDALACARTHYDVIILDCPPHSGTLTINALTAADRVLIPCEPGPLGLHGVEGLLDVIGPIHERLNPGLDLLGVVITRIDRRNTRLNDEILQTLDERLGEALLPIRIGVNARLAQAQQAGKDIFSFDPTCRGAADYRELAEYVDAQAVSPFAGR